MKTKYADLKYPLIYMHKRQEYLVVLVIVKKPTSLYFYCRKKKKGNI